LRNTFVVKMKKNEENLGSFLERDEILNILPAIPTSKKT